MNRRAASMAGRTCAAAAFAISVLAAAMVDPPWARAQVLDPEPTPRPAWLQNAPPAAWAETPGLARSVARALRQSALFGDSSAGTGAAAHVERGVGAFYLSWLESEAPASVEALRAALDRLRARRLLSSPEAQSTEELRYGEEVTGDAARTELRWRHISNETLSDERAFLWLGPGGQPRLAVAECVISTDGGKAPPAAEAICRAALASVSIAVPPGQRGKLAALPASRSSDDGRGPRLSLGEPGAEAPAGRPPPTIGPPRPGADGAVLYRGPEPQPDAGDPSMNRWLVLVGVGLLAVALYFKYRWRRDRGEDKGDDDPEAPPPPGSPPAPPGSAQPPETGPERET